MSNFLLYHQNSVDTGKALAEALNIEHGFHLPEQRFNFVIRWGNRERVRYTPAKVLNKTKGMDVAANKDRALQFMRENHIPCPPPVTSFNGKLLLARKSEHMHGSNCFFVTSQFDFDNAKRVGCTNFSEFVPTVREFRVHVFQGQPVFIYERVCPRNPNSLNIRNDWDEVRREVNEVPRVIIDTAVDCVTKMQLDFGAVDIALSVRGSPFIYEVNTAPALVDGERKKPSFAVYERKIREWLEE